MGKRLTRISSENIFAKLGSTSGELLVNAVPRSGNTCFGKLKSVSAEFLTILDTREHTHILAIADIFEVIYDEKSKP